MRFIIIPLGIVIAAVTAVSVLLLRDIPVSTSAQHWDIKKKEAVDRLLEVPVILYHNIDGRGPYSVTSGQLDAQFSMIREMDIRVIPLSLLMDHLAQEIPFKGKVLVITFDDGYLSNYTRLLPLVKKYHYPITLFVYTDFIRKSADSAMTWKRLRILEQNGVTIQSHTQHHDDLTVLTSDGWQHRKRLFDEIYLSRRIIELNLGKTVDYFAFPYGRYNLKLIDMAAMSSYSRVFSTDYGSNIITRNNYCLRRHHIKGNYSLSRFRKIIN